MNDYDVKNIGNMIREPEHFAWFTCHVIRLIAKADETNREKIRLAYPDHVAAFEHWQLNQREV